MSEQIAAKLDEARSRAAVCRLVEVDFEKKAIRLVGLGIRLPPLASGNYIVVPQEAWLELRALIEPARAS